MTEPAIPALTEALSAELGDSELAGRVVVVLAPPGIGKTALLVHAALDAMRAGRAVLHVAVADSVDHVRAHYEQVASVLGLGPAERAAAERFRMIHSYLDKVFDTAPLRDHLALLRNAAQFEPSLVVVDGLDSEAAVASIEGLADLAGELGVPLWLTLRASEDGSIPAIIRSTGSIGVTLAPAAEGVQLSVLRNGQENALDLVLTPEAALVPASRIGSVKQLEPGGVTLYSGGSKGAEAAFGALAAQYGLTEMNFSFPGHSQARTTARHELSARELAAGDVSMVYVSRRLSRTYSTEGTLIRKILQTLWHMVSRSQKVLVVGVIQEDGTVVGGTGWSVELARMWNKDLWVYDQERRGWFNWDGHRWVAGETIIDSLHVCGTGTRYLEPHGQEALEALFARSFG